MQVPVAVCSIATPFDEIVNEMKRSPLCARIQIDGSTELGRLLPFLQVENQSEYEKISLTILCAMRNHSDNVDVQQAACSTFRQLATVLSTNCNRSETSRANCFEEIMISGGILHQILKSMGSISSKSFHRDTLHILRCVLSISATSKAYVKVKEMLESERCIESIICAMWQHSSCNDIQENGCLILWGLCYRSCLLEEAILRNDGAMAILHAMAIHPENLEIQKNACGALYTLSFEEDVCSSLLSNGGVNILTAALQSLSYSQDVVEKALTSLVNITLANEDFCILGDVDILIISNVLDLFENSENGGAIRKMSCFLLQTARKRHHSRAVLESLRVEEILSRALAKESGSKVIGAVEDVSDYTSDINNGALSTKASSECSERRLQKFPLHEIGALTDSPPGAASGCTSPLSNHDFLGDIPAEPALHLFSESSRGVDTEPDAFLHLGQLSISGQSSSASEISSARGKPPARSPNSRTR